MSSEEPPTQGRPDEGGDRRDGQRAALARDAGYDPVDAGPLWSAFNVEKVAGVMVTIAYVVGAGFDQALKIIRR
jgi:predicted dinucleotide-binding enzyme